MLRITGMVLFCLFFAFPAQARQHHHRHHRHVHHHRIAASAVSPFVGWWNQPAVYYAPRVARTVPERAVAHGEVVAHPAGCPTRAFCGCGAAVRVFGHSVRELWLAVNWFRFPRASPAPGMVAVRRHHVMVLEADLGGGVWQVYDANSGRHLTRVHARSIAGYVIVSPRA